MINRLAKYTETSICSEVTRDSFLMYWVIHIFIISVFRALDIILFRYIQTRIWIGYIKDIICTEHYTHFCTQCKVSSVKFSLSFKYIQIYVNHLKPFYCKMWYWKKGDTIHVCSITLTKKNSTPLAPTCCKGLPKDAVSFLSVNNSKHFECKLMNILWLSCKRLKIFYI